VIVLTRYTYIDQPTPGRKIAKMYQISI